MEPEFGVPTPSGHRREDLPGGPAGVVHVPARRAQVLVPGEVGEAGEIR